MDRYNNCVTKGKCNLDSTPLPGRIVLAGSDLSKRYKVGTRTPNIYNVEISFDQFLSCIRNNRFMNNNCFLNITIYDEAVATTREELMLRYQFLKYLNNFRNARFNFNLSDSTLPAYIAFMNSINWKHDDITTFKMTIDRNPTTSKNIPLEQARGKISIKPDKLQLYSDRTLRLVKNKIKEDFVVEDAEKLKKLTTYIRELIEKNYYYNSLSDYEKAFIIYHYLFDVKNANNIKIRPLSISYADEQTYYENGVQKLKPSYSRWESRAIGTLEHGKGVCTGQARLYSSLLCNPKINIPAEATFGNIPSGEHHSWVSMVINNRLYQCCTTMEGLYANLDRCGYIPDDKQLLQTVYPHSSLNDLDKQKIKQHLKRLER